MSRLKDKRLQVNMSLKEMAEKAGYDLSTTRRVENESIPFTDAMKANFAKALRCAPEEFNELRVLAAMPYDNL